MFDEYRPAWYASCMIFVASKVPFIQLILHRQLKQTTKSDTMDIGGDDKQQNSLKLKFICVQKQAEKVLFMHMFPIAQHSFSPHYCAASAGLAQPIRAQQGLWGRR